MSGQPSAPKRTAQLELNAANLAQQRQQPFEARMPRIRGKAGAKDLLPLGREGAVCSLCKTRYLDRRKQSAPGTTSHIAPAELGIRRASTP